jgi:SAM-dependent methyltransferase
MLTEALIRLKDRTFNLHFASDHIARWCQEYVADSPSRPIRILDIGLGSARDLLRVRRVCAKTKLALYGIEAQEIYIQHAKDNGITTFSLNMEEQPLPVDDEFFDIIISNHVIEHTKEIYWIFAEVARTLKKGGIAIIGCPNLASWHNRLALLVGKEPPCMKLLGPHVRGITRPGFRTMIEHGGYFKLIRYNGSNFFPFPAGLNKLLAGLFPTLCASQQFVIQRTEKVGSFLEVLDSGVPGIADTPYFRGGHVRERLEASMPAELAGHSYNGQQPQAVKV